MQEKEQPGVKFALVLKRLLRESGKTQVELARALGISQAAISKWFNGTMPNARKIPEIARFLNVSIDALLTQVEGEKRVGHLRESAPTYGTEKKYKKSNISDFEVIDVLLEVLGKMIELGERCSEAKRIIDRWKAEKDQH